MPEDFNPIKSVDGKVIPSPSGYTYDDADISQKDAGRTEDLVMQKKRIGQQKRIQLTWAYLNDEQISVVLNAFDPEYIFVEYYDAKAKGYVTKEFYVTDRSAVMYNKRLGLWTSLSFNIVERKIT